MDRDTILSARREVFDERARIGQDEHRENHDWVRGQIGAWLASAVVWAAAYLRDKKVTSQR